MKMFENKNFRLSTIEYIGVAVFIGLMIAVVFSFKSYSDVRERFNIEKTEVDFIIQAPSTDQVSEIESLDHIDWIVPYYFRSVNVSTGKKSTVSSLFIIENAEDIGYTTFSDKLLINKGDAVDNALYVTNDFSKNVNVKVGDTVDIAIDGTVLTFTVAGIYKSDYRNVGGALLTVMNSNVKDAMKTYRYSGAYVASSNLLESEKYFEDEYIPRGDIRERSEFESDEAYQIYLETHAQSDSTMDAFVTANYITELSKRNEGKLIRSIVLMTTMFAVAYIIITMIVSIRASNYTKENVLRDVRDNFTVDQELRMYSKYFGKVTVILLVVNIVIGCMGYIAGWMRIVSVINIFGMIFPPILLAVCGNVQKNKLKKRFLIEKKKYEEEKKRLEEEKRNQKRWDV